MEKTKVYLGCNTKNIEIEMDVNETLLNLADWYNHIKEDLTRTETNKAMRAQIRKELHSIESDMCYITQFMRHEKEQTT
jgi:hypothetical protein